MLINIFLYLLYFNFEYKLEWIFRKKKNITIYLFIKYFTELEKKTKKNIYNIIIKY